VRGVYFTNTRSVADYYDEISDGQMSLTGDVFGWFTVPADTTACNQKDWGDAARAAATAAGIDLTAYTNVAVVFPKQSVCWWVGMAQLPGRNSYVNGSAGWTYATWLFTATHELGHNFGMNHASTLSCTKGGVRVAFSDNCSLDEYGDPFDTMGGNGQRHFNTWHRWQIGLLGASDVQTVTTSGVYRVATAEVTGGVPRVLRVTRPSGNYYYLEFRQPYGRYDNFATTAAVVNGVSIRIAAGVGSESFSKLLDTNPQTNTFSDAALGVGRGFADNVNDIFIVTQAIDPTGATVLVHVGPDTVSPTAPGALQATSDAAGAISLRWAPSTDDVLVTGYRVGRDGAVIAKVGGTSFDDLVLPQGHTYVYTVSAIDLAGNIGPAATVSFVVPDTVAPGSAGPLTATATGPNSVALAWVAAGDNVGVTSYRLSRNGTVIGTTGTTTFVDSAAPDGIALTYQVRALDGWGNVGPAASAGLTLPDVTGPTLGGPLGLTVASDGTINVSWPAATDNVAVSGYTVSRDGAQVATTPNASYADAGLAQARTYQYSVTALDTATNSSVPLTGSIYLPDVTPPSAPGSFSALATGASSVALSWSAATDNVGVTGYRLSRDGVRLATVDGSIRAFTDTGATTNQAHTYTLIAIDAAGNRGATATAGVTLAATDVTPPSVPLNLRAVALSRRRISLSWAPSTDDQPGTLRYRVFRGRNRIATVTTTSYVDRPSVSGWYKYRVRAVDAAGNKSSFSVAVWVKAHA
jgi:chitodextrinase